MNFTLLSAMEFPGYGISYFGMQYWGRKVRLTINFFQVGNTFTYFLGMKSYFTLVCSSGAGR